MYVVRDTYVSMCVKHNSIIFAKQNHEHVFSGVTIALCMGKKDQYQAYSSP